MENPCHAELEYQENKVKVNFTPNAEELTGELFSVKYDQGLMDIAGNQLDVKMVQQDYDPVSDRLVAQFLDKKVPQYLPPAEHKEPMVFKYDTQAEYEECLPKHTPKMRPFAYRNLPIPDRVSDIEAPKRHTEQQPNPQIRHPLSPLNVQPIQETL